MDVLSLASRLQTTIFGTKSDDDFSDRLNYRYTVGLLLLGSIIITTRQYGSEVIKCWVPAHFTNNYESYVSQICWVENTYYFPMDKDIPKLDIEKEKNEIKYYQWVNFLLLIQAFLYYTPRIFWNTFSIKAGLYLGDLVEAAINYKSGDKFEEKKTYMDYMVKNIDQFVDDKRRHDESRTKSKIFRLLMTCFPCVGRFLGNYIVVLYIITKFIFIANAAAQIYLVGGLLGQDFWSLGVRFVVQLIQGKGWVGATSTYFPKVTLCDFMIREIGNPNKSHRYTVQCVLPINLFNQQIFTVIWFWYVMVLSWNVCGLIMWSHRCIPIKSNEWIMRRVDLFNECVKQKLVKKRLKHFLNYYLEPDGIFMIRMIANNTSDYVATDLIHNLWCQHHEKYGFLFPDEPHHSKMPCMFVHSEKMKGLHVCNQSSQVANQQSPNTLVHNEFNPNGNYASFGQVYRGNVKFNNNQQQEYYRINENNQLVVDSDRTYPPSYITEETAHLVRKREVDDSSTKV